MSPSGPLPQVNSSRRRPMASGGARPKRNFRVDDSFYEPQDSSSEEIRQLRSALFMMDRKLSRSLGMPPGIRRDPYEVEREEELLLIRRSIIQMDSRLSVLLHAKEEEDATRITRDPTLSLLSRSVQQCLQGLSKLSTDVNRLRHSFLRETRRSQEDDSTLFEYEYEDARTPTAATAPTTNFLNNQPPPNNYWDNFTRNNPSRRVKSKINRENNDVLLPSRTPGRAPGEGKKKRLMGRMPGRPSLDVNHLSSEPRHRPEDEILDEEDFKSVFDVVLLSQESLAGESERAVGEEEVSEASGLVVMTGGSSNNNSNERASRNVNNNNNADVDCLIETGGKLNDLCLEDEEVFKIQNTFFLSEDDEEDENYQSQEDSDR